MRKRSTCSFKDILPAIKLQRLKKLADLCLKSAKDKLIIVHVIPHPGNSPEERFKTAGVHLLLEADRPWLLETLGISWLVIAEKVFLRRTCPMNEIPV